MMVIKGSGGEGKSQIGVVLSRLFGCNMKDGSIGKISENRFARADLEHTLLCVDDDMRMEALRQTNYVKSIVTAQGQMDLERKTAADPAVLLLRSLPESRKILLKLQEGKISSGDLAIALDMTPQALSYHLSKLKKADLIYETRYKNYIYYELNLSILDEAIMWIRNLRGEQR